MPDRNLAVVLFVNGGNAAALYRRMYGEILGTLADITLPILPSEQNIGLEFDKYAGTYERLAARLIVEAKNGRLLLTQINR